MNYYNKKKREIIIVHLAMIFISFICLFPIFWMIMISLKPGTESISGLQSNFVKLPSLENYK